MIARVKLKLGISALIVLFGVSTSEAQVAGNPDQHAQTPNSAIFRLQDLNNQTKMRMAFAKMLSIGALRKYEREDQNEEGIFKSTRPLALIENDIGATLLTATEADQEDKFATAQLRVFRLSYKDNSFFLIGKPEVFDVFNYGKIVDWKISNDFAEHPVATFLEHGGGSGCYNNTLNLLSITPMGSIRTELPISYSYSFGGKDEEVKGTIFDIRKNKYFTMEIVRELKTNKTRTKSVEFEKYIYDSGAFRILQGESKIQYC